MRYYAKGDTFVYVKLARDPSNNGELIDIVDSGGVWCWEHGNAASTAVITTGCSFTKITGSGAPSNGAYIITIDTSGADFEDDKEYTPVIVGDIVSGGTTGITGAELEAFRLSALMTQATVQSECEDAIKAVLLPLYSGITTVNSQVSFDLTTGPANDHALLGADVIFRDGNGAFAGFATIIAYDYIAGTPNVYRITVNHAPFQTITTNHTVTVLPSGQKRAIEDLEKQIVYLTVTAVTSATQWSATAKNFHGDVIDNTYVDNFLAFRPLNVISVQGGSNTSSGDSTFVSTNTWNVGDSDWDIVTSALNVLAGAPAVGDILVAGLFA